MNVVLSSLPSLPESLHHKGHEGGEDSVGRRVHPEKRSVSWVNSVLRQFLPHGPTAGRYFPEILFS